MATSAGRMQGKRLRCWLELEKMDHRQIASKDCPPAKRPSDTA